MGWIKNLSNGKGAVGITLEKMLNIESNEFEVPDYELAIELKTKSSYFNNTYPITLFSATCDGSELYELRRIKDKFGVFVKKYNSRVLFLNLYCNKYSYIGNFYKAKLHINYLEKKIFFVIFNSNNKIVDYQAFWPFEILYSKLYRKLQILAFVEADRKLVRNEFFFRYKNITFYKLKNFNTFIKLIEDGIICINVKIGVYKRGPKFGKTHDHGTSFQIHLSDIEKLYTKI